MFSQTGDTLGAIVQRRKEEAVNAMITLPNVTDRRHDLLDLTSEFCARAYDYYLCTGHDLLECPDKQTLVAARARDADVVESLIREGKKRVVCLERRIAEIIEALDGADPRLVLIQQAESQSDSGAASGLCSSILEMTSSGRIRLRHLTIAELSSLGLDFTL